jgi:hypothetical protein
MRLTFACLTIALILGATLPASAQTVPLLQSAETVDKGVFKLVIAPALLLGKHGANSEFGVAVRGGYGFVNRFDGELKAAIYENSTLLGGDGEVWLLNSSAVDLSVTGGLHWIFADGGNNSFGGNDAYGFELTPTLSVPVQKGVDLYGGLMASFERIKDLPPGADDSFTRLHFIPGIEYSLSPEADLSGEFGIGLNEDSWHYASFAIEFYLR